MESIKMHIQVGDIVDVQFERLSSIFDAEVIYISAPPSGDIYHLKSKEGALIIVQNFCTITVNKSVDESKMPDPREYGIDF